MRGRDIKNAINLLMAFFCLKLANKYIKADDFRVNYVEMKL